MTEEDIDKTLTLANELKGGKTDQNQKEVDRSKAALERIQLMNAAYLIAKQICKSAKVIFEDNPPLYKVFLLPWSSEKVSKVYSGSISAGDQRIIPFKKLKPGTLLKFEIKTIGMSLRGCGLEDKNSSCEGGDIFSNGNIQTRTLISLSSDLNPKYLKITHNIMGANAPDAEFTITIVEL